MVLDTDILIRYFTKDDIQKAQTVATLLKSGVRPTVTDITFAEIFWVLKSFYKFPREKILTGFQKLLHTKSVRYNERIITKTFEYLKHHPVSFVDAYTAAHAFVKDDSVVISYDEGFDKLSGITRKEP